MSDNTFDTDSFLDTQIEQNIDTTFEPIPEGDYPATVMDGDNAINIRSGVSTKGNAWCMMDVVWEIDDKKLAEEIGRNPLRVRQSIFLDMTKQGGLDLKKGQNRQLGFLREALGQNSEGQPWSPRMLQGQPALINVGQRPSSENPEIVYNEVKRVTRLV